MQEFFKIRNKPELIEQLHEEPVDKPQPEKIPRSILFQETPYQATIQRPQFVKQAVPPSKFAIS
jgi:hypothetical protein